MKKQKKRAVRMNEQPTPDKPLRVAELFAGVGGFRVGLHAVKRGGERCFETVWSNQWEPASNKQYAYDIYVKHFGREGNINEDIARIDVNKIFEHDVLVGGFPCQDYSVAKTLSQAEGIVGKKGVLWWQIHRILKERTHKPSYLILENVDRLLKSPASQRGRDFAIMLKSLSELGYIVEWRVVNAADYGFPQRRRRVFILGYLKGTPIHRQATSVKRHADWMTSAGVLAKALPVSLPKGVLVADPNVIRLQGDLSRISDTFGKVEPVQEFMNCGMIVGDTVFTLKVEARFRGKQRTLRSVLDKKPVPAEYYVDASDLKQWKALKGAKSILRVNKKTGFEYKYTEGGMAFPDDLDAPSRTIVTGEGGSTPSRFKHIIQQPDGRYRRLTPTELERLNGFRAGWTKGAPDARRAFLMGNALVVGIVRRIGKALFEASNSPQKVQECSKETVSV